MFVERDFEKKPYTKDEQRAVDYIQLITGGTVGAGDDPIGFLIASHSYTQRERRKAAEEIRQLKQVEEMFYYLAKWVERGLFDHKLSQRECLEAIAYHPGMPWTEGRWDVDHKPYANEFYKKFPKAKADASVTA